MYVHTLVTVLCQCEEQRNYLQDDSRVVVPEKVSSRGYGYVIWKSLAPGRILEIRGITVQ